MMEMLKVDPESIAFFCQVLSSVCSLTFVTSVVIYQV